MHLESCAPERIKRRLPLSIAHKELRLLRCQVASCRFLESNKREVSQDFTECFFPSLSLYLSFTIVYNYKLDYIKFIISPSFSRALFKQIRINFSLAKKIMINQNLGYIFISFSSS